ncbi:MAG TPA: PEP-CTERM sorting domain-containing protein [Phycisphaerales bacterium]
MVRPSTVALLAAAFAAAASAHAASVFRGIDNNTGFVFPLITTPSTDQARNDFLTAIAGLGTQYYSDIESNANGALPDAINFSGGQSANAVGARGEIRDSVFNSAFGTHGSRFIYTEADDSTDVLTLTFNQPILAIGFTWTDAMDWFDTNKNPPSLLVTLGTGPNAQTFDLITALQSQDIRDGSVGYFGIIADTAFDRITISRPLGGGVTDAVGFDDITFVIPAPASLAMLGVGLLAAGRRRR